MVIQVCSSFFQETGAQDCRAANDLLKLLITDNKYQAV